MDKLKYLFFFQAPSHELEHYINQYNKKLTNLGPISQVNILVGATNSGKSRLMRGILKTSPYKFLTVSPLAADPDLALDTCIQLSRIPFEIQLTIGQKSSPEISVDANSLAQEKSPMETNGPRALTYATSDFKNIHRLLQQEISDTGVSTATNERRNTLIQLVEKYHLLLDTLDKSYSKREEFHFSGDELGENTKRNIKTVIDFVIGLCSFDPAENIPFEPSKIYLPVYRTAIQLKIASKSDTADYYAQTIQENYHLGAQQDKGKPPIDVFTGNHLYWKVKEEKGGDPIAHKRLIEFERFLGNTFFEGRSIILKSLDEKYTQGKHVLALLIDEQIQRQFHDLGDGIQAIIILMYRLFTAPEKSWIFIEEPEQGLHPGLQRIFLETITRHPVIKEKELVIFFTTHSNHLLGMAISEPEDVSVFSFQRWSDPERFEIRPVFTRQQYLLTQLGVANSSVFMANCSVWVEGITDRRYLKAYLSAYLQSDDFKKEYSFIPQEDIHYGFFEYAGSNISHYIFNSEDDSPPMNSELIHSQFLCNKVFLLADKDFRKEEKHERLRGSQNDNFEYYVTPGIEIENLISEVELSKALSKLIKGLTPEKISSLAIKFSDYKDKHLGSYLKEIVGDLCPEAIKSSSGSLNAYYKDKLACLVCPEVTWENMSEDARNLAKALYEFIYKHNQIAPQVQ